MLTLRQKKGDKSTKNSNNNDEVKTEDGGEAVDAPKHSEKETQKETQKDKTKESGKESEKPSK